MGAQDAAMDAKLAAAAATPSAVSRVDTSSLAGIAVASDPALKALQTTANQAAINAAQNTGAGPDAQYDQRAAAKAAQAYADALDKALFAQKTTTPAAPTPVDTKPVDTQPTNTGSTVTVSAQPFYTPSATPASPPPIKTATPQYILFNDDEVPIDAVVDLLFENIGGQELLTIARADTVNGQKVLYQPIKNLNILKEQYNPNNIVRLQNTSDKFFSNFSIKLADKIPNVGNGTNGSNVYLDSNGNLVIEFVNLADDEQAEIEITSSGIIAEVGI